MVTDNPKPIDHDREAPAPQDPPPVPDVYQEIERLRQQVVAHEDAERHAMTEALHKRLANVPEAMRSLIPDYDDPVKLFLWLERNADLLKGRTAPDLNAGTTSPARAENYLGSTDHLAEVKRRFRIGGRKY